MFDQWLFEFDQAILLLEERVGQFTSEDHTLDETAEFLVRLHAAKEDLSSIYGVIERLARDALDGQDLYVLPDGSTIERKTSVSRTGWKHADLAEVVAKRIVSSSVDFETGEVLRDEQEMIQELLRYAGIGYWKIKELDGIGIDADQYCTKGDPKQSVTVRRIKE